MHVLIDVTDVNRVVKVLVDHDTIEDKIIDLRCEVLNDRYRLRCLILSMGLMVARPVPYDFFLGNELTEIIRNFINMGIEDCTQYVNSLRAASKVPLASFSLLYQYFNR